MTRYHHLLGMYMFSLADNFSRNRHLNNRLSKRLVSIDVLVNQLDQAEDLLPFSEDFLKTGTVIFILFSWSVTEKGPQKGRKDHHPGDLMSDDLLSKDLRSDDD